MNANNIYDYLIPVGDAGDKIFTNGQQDKVVTGEQERKAEDLIKQIAMKKQLDLERGNAEHILEMLKQDTPEAAIYRALLLQQLEKQKGNTNELKKRDEDNKPGVVRRVAGWVGRKTLGAAKYMGYMALQYLAWKAIMNAGDIYRDGPVKTWKKWQLENGIARTPDLAEKFGDANAAVGDGIYKRDVALSDLPKEARDAIIKYGDEKFGKEFNTAASRVKMKNVFKDAKGDYLEKLPEGIDPSKFESQVGFFLDTGDKKNAILPISREAIGEKTFDNALRVGDATSVINGSSNAFWDDPNVRTFDSITFNIADKSGYNKQMKSNWRIYDPPKPKKQIAQVADEGAPQITPSTVPTKEAPENAPVKTEEKPPVKKSGRKQKFYGVDLSSIEDREFYDELINVGNFAGNLAENTYRAASTVDNHYKFNAKNVLKTLDMIKGKSYTDPSAYPAVFKNIDVNYTDGIKSGYLPEFLVQAAMIRNEFPNPKDKGKMMDKLNNLINIYNDRTWTARRYNPPSLKPIMKIKNEPYVTNPGTWVSSGLWSILGIAGAVALYSAISAGSGGVVPALTLAATGAAAGAAAATVADGAADATGHGYRFPKRRLRKRTIGRAHLKKTTKDRRRKRR